MLDDSYVSAVPSAAQVLRALADECEDLEGTVEKVILQRATDFIYPARLYMVGEEEYEGRGVNFT
jgi:hypothetical protein